MPRRGPIERAVYRDLDGHLLASGLGQATLAAARRMDNAASDDRDFAVLARELRQALAELRKSQPVVESEDSLAQRRARRAAARTAG